MPTIEPSTAGSEATGLRRKWAGPDSPRYKWVALSNTTLGVLMATMNSSIVLISLPAIFRGIHIDPLPGLPKITGTRVHDRPVVGWSGPCRVAQSPNSCRHTTVGVSLDMSCSDAVES